MRMSKSTKKSNLPPQASTSANNLITKTIALHVYYKCNHILGLCKHNCIPVILYLVVNQYGLKYAEKKHAENLVACIIK